MSFTDLVSTLMVHRSAPSGGSRANEGLGEEGCWKEAGLSRLEPLIPTRDTHIANS